MELSKWFLSIIAELSWMSVVFSASKDNPLVGVLMCKKKCFTTNACEQLAYSSFTLGCYLRGDKITSFDLHTYTFYINKNDLVKTDARCMPGDIILHTKQGFIHCLPGERSTAPAQTTRNLPRVKARRLLFCPRRGQEMASVSQVTLQQSLTPKRYPHLTLMKIYSLLYSPITNSVYVAYFSKTSFLISVSSLDSFKTERCVRVESIGVMVLDEGRDWIITCRRPFDGVYKIVGQNQTTMFKSRNRTNRIITSMAVYSKNKIIYVADGSNIHKFTYNGKGKLLVRTRGVGPLCLDPTGRYIYYDTAVSADKFIFRYDTITNKAIPFIPLLKSLQDIAVDSYGLYVKPEKTNILVFKLSTRKVTGSIIVEAMDEYILCLVE